MITQEHLGRAMNYQHYRSLLQQLMAQGKTTGNNQSDAYLHYAKLNLQRMLRLDKTVRMIEELVETLKKINGNYIWVVLTEGWCGDAAQNIPIMATIENMCPNISLKLLLRDENLDLMNQYLTGSSLSIPKLICVEATGLKEMFVWGPRPDEVQALMIDLKKKNTPSEEKALLIQKWYNADKTISLQSELASLIAQFLTQK